MSSSPAALGDVAPETIARQYGLTPRAISSIKYGRNWGHVTIDAAEPGQSVGQLTFDMT